MKAPSHLQERIRQHGGVALDGRPIFRVVWGGSRLTWIGGEWKKYDSSGNYTGSWIGTMKVLKYPDAKERWIFEVLCPPENYGTEYEWGLQWTKWIEGRRVEELGPYPRHGEYEQVKVLETPKHHAFVPLTATICDALVETAKLNRNLPVNIRYEAAKERREAEEREKEQRMIDRINDMGLAFDGKPYSIHPGFKEDKKTEGGLYLP